MSATAKRANFPPPLPLFAPWNHCSSPGFTLGTRHPSPRGLPLALPARVENDERGMTMIKQAEIYRQNAENCVRLAEAAENEPAFNRFKRMEAAWLALAEEQDWLDGKASRIDERALV
jgi:hypothetical protein